MSLGVNKVILLGNLGKDPVTQDIGNGIKKATFSIATTESIPGRDGVKTDHTEWHNIVVWRGLADVAEKYLRKGSTIYLEGRLRSRQYDDKDGVKRYITEITCDNLVMVGGKPSGTGTGPVVSSQSEPYINAGMQGSNLNSQQENTTFTSDNSNDDLPF
ncbi:MAG: single-stranded DNA-binding protein [Bacteroidetes bacterium]|nr:single-stranded DNA-binding protein [Bacteroidota bacterium]